MTALQKRLQQQFANFKFRFKKPQMFDDNDLHLFTLMPNQRSKQILQKISKILRTLKFFAEKIIHKPEKYKEIVQVISPFVEIRQFRPGESITITGEKCNYLNFLYEGKVYVYIPTNQRSYINSIKLRNTQKKANRQQYMKILNQNYNQNQNTILTAQQATDIIKSKGLANDLINPHIYHYTLQTGDKISTSPLKWKLRQFEQCIALCIKKTLVISLRKQIYNEIYLFQMNQKKKNNIKLLSKFCKFLSQPQILKYASEITSQNYEQKQEILLAKDQIYLVAQGEVSIGIIKKGQIVQSIENLKKSTKINSKLKVLCTIYRGEALGRQDIQNLKYYAKTKCRILKLRGGLINFHMDISHQFRNYIEELLQTKRKLLSDMILNSQEVANNMNNMRLIKQKEKSCEIVRTGIQDLSMIQVLKKLSKKESKQEELVYNDSQKSVQASFSKTRSNSICLILSHKNSNSKLIRSKRIENQDNKKQFFEKFGLLSTAEITKHNSQLIKKKSIDKLPKIHQKRPPSKKSQKKSTSRDIQLVDPNQSPSQSRTSLRKLQESQIPKISYFSKLSDTKQFRMQRLQSIKKI